MTLRPQRVHLRKRGQLDLMTIAISGREIHVRSAVIDRVVEHDTEAAAAAEFSTLLNEAVARGLELDPLTSPNPEPLPPDTTFSPADPDEAWWHRLVVGWKGRSVSPECVAPGAAVTFYFGGDDDDDPEALARLLPRIEQMGATTLQILEGGRALLTAIAKRGLSGVRRLLVDTPWDRDKLVFAPAYLRFGELGAVFAAMPELTSAVVIGSFQLRAFHHPRLEALHLLADPMPAAVVNGLAASDLPKLRELSLGIAYQNAPPPATIAAFAKLVRGPALPGLRSLMGVGFGSAEAFLGAALQGSRTLAMLHGRDRASDEAAVEALLRTARDLEQTAIRLGLPADAIRRIADTAGLPRLANLGEPDPFDCETYLGAPA